MRWILYSLHWQMRQLGLGELNWATEGPQAGNVDGPGKGCRNWPLVTELFLHLPAVSWSTGQLLMSETRAWVGSHTCSTSLLLKSQLLTTEYVRKEGLTSRFCVFHSALGLGITRWWEVTGRALGTALHRAADMDTHPLSITDEKSFSSSPCNPSAALRPAISPNFLVSPRSEFHSSQEGPRYLHKAGRNMEPLHPVEAQGTHDSSRWQEQGG